MTHEAFACPHRRCALSKAMATRLLGFQTVDLNDEPRLYSPHGLRRLCGVELSLAGATAEQIAAALGHASTRQTAVYVKQADQLMLARRAQRLRDEMYERERRETAIAAADNVARLEAPHEGRANRA